MLNGRVNDSSPRRRLPSFSFLPLRFVLCSVCGWRQPKIVGEIRVLIALYVGPAATTDATTLPHWNSATLRSDAWHGMKQLKLQLKLHWPNVDRQIQFKLRTLDIVCRYHRTKASHGMKSAVWGVAMRDKPHSGLQSTRLWGYTFCK